MTLQASFPIGRYRVDLCAGGVDTYRWVMSSAGGAHQADGLLGGPDGVTSEQLRDAWLTLAAFEAHIGKPAAPDLMTVCNAVSLGGGGVAEVADWMPTISEALDGITTAVADELGQRDLWRALSMVENDVRDGDQVSLDLSLQSLRFAVRAYCVHRLGGVMASDRDARQLEGL